MSKTLDYSKWDKIDYSSSSSDDEGGNDQAVGAPRVTRLDTPSRVTRTTSGDLVVEQQCDHGPTLSQASASTMEQNNKSPADAKESFHPSSWTENGGQEEIASSSSSSSSKRVLFWSQDRHSVCLRMSIPSTIKGKDIKVQLKGARRYADRQSAVGSATVASIKVTSSSNDDILLDGDFPHPIHVAEDDDDYVDEETPFYSADWNIDRTNNNNNNEAFWVMTVFKAVPMDGVVIWWRRPTTQFAEIEVLNPNAKSQAFQQAWEEAHRQFRDKVKQKKHTVP